MASSSSSDQTIWFSFCRSASPLVPLCQVWVRVAAGCPGARETQSQVSVVCAGIGENQQVLVGELERFLLDLEQGRAGGYLAGAVRRATEYRHTALVGDIGQRE